MKVNSRQRFLNALNRLPNDRPPFWLMRQAGRCLPEYRALRERYSFRQLITTPELAAEVTLQPVRRLGFDAAIIFSDILVVPEVMGVPFEFNDRGELSMKPLGGRDDIDQLQPEAVEERLIFVAEALMRTRVQLEGGTALIGFAGSPWTLANFMLEGGSPTQGAALRLFQNDRPAFNKLCEKLTRATIDYLRMQLRFKADAVQIFDSLGGLLPAEHFHEASGRWMHEIIAALGPDAPVILYSKGARNWAELASSGARVIGVDHEIDIAEARRVLPETVGIQGNLPPELLSKAGPPRVEAETRRILEAMRGRDGYIFNLGHGVPKDARMENLEILSETVRRFT